MEVSLADSDSDLESLESSDLSVSGFDSDSEVESGVSFRHSDEVSLRQSEEVASS